MNFRTVLSFVWRASISLMFLLGPAVPTSSRLMASNVGVKASLETEPVVGGGDSADDPAIWVHPNKAELSTVIGTDKEGAGMVVYDLEGRLIQFLPMLGANNVDLRYGFPFGDEKGALVVASNPAANSLEMFRVDPKNRKLMAVSVRNNRSSVKPWGVCMYQSQRSGRYYVFNIGRRGQVEQWEIKSNGETVRLNRVRSFKLGSDSEGCVADDDSGVLYISEQEVGIWRFGAEPDAGSNGRLVAKMANQGGHLHADVEGLAIYDGGKGKGYLIASSQGNDSFVIYNRSTNAFVGEFKIKHGHVDGVSNTDGIEVNSRFLGANFPKGLFVAQDGRNIDAMLFRRRQNFKLVPWETVASAFKPELRIDP